MTIRRASKRRGFLGVATMLWTAAVCVADVPSDPGAGDARLRPAPNQSVSIDAAVGVQEVQPVDEGLPTVEEGAGRSAQAESNAGSLTIAPPSSRFARRRLAPVLGDGAVNERSTPWYRTGIGALAVVLALVAGAYWVVRRWMPSARTVDAGVMKLVGRTGLTPKQSLALVQVGRRYVVVGVSPDRLDSLCEISDPEEVAELGLRIGSQRTGSADEFNALLAGEASDYPDASPPVSDLRERESSQRAGTPGALKELLARLRTMQTKQSAH